MVGKNTGSRNAFTIVELLVVIVVIGILAAVLLVGYSAVSRNAQDTAFKAELTKLGDNIKLFNLDNNGVLAGGATSSLAGDSTVLSGVKITPAKELYDQTGINFFYCAGTIDGNEDFAIIAKSKTGGVFAYRGNANIVKLADSTAMNYSTLCPAAGFSAPYTWSYGFNPAPQYGWFPWANGSAPTIKNIALNPQGVGSTANFFVPYPATVTATPNVSWNGKTNWYRYIWNGANYNTNRLMLNLSDLTDGKSYTTSLLVGNDGSVARTFSLDFSDQGQTTFTVQPGESKRVSFTTSRPTYDSTYRFIDFNPIEANGTGLLIGELMVTEGTTQYAFRDGNSVGWTWSGAANASTSSGPAPN